MTESWCSQCTTKWMLISTNIHRVCLEYKAYSTYHKPALQTNNRRFLLYIFTDVLQKKCSLSFLISLSFNFILLKIVMYFPNVRYSPLVIDDSYAHAIRLKCTLEGIMDAGYFQYIAQHNHVYFCTFWQKTSNIFHIIKENILTVSNDCTYLIYELSLLHNKINQK